jgi:hypothetical protein
VELERMMGQLQLGKSTARTGPNFVKTRFFFIRLKRHEVLLMTAVTEKQPAKTPLTDTVD